MTEEEEKKEIKEIIENNPGVISWIKDKLKEYAKAAKITSSAISGLTGIALGNELGKYIRDNYNNNLSYAPQICMAVFSGTLAVGGFNLPDAIREALDSLNKNKSAPRLK